MTQKVTLAQLQEEHLPWSKKNFGDGPPYQPLLGLMEEVSELIEPCEAFFFHHKELEEVKDEIADSLADIVIFGCDYANRMDWRMSEIEHLAKGRDFGRYRDEYSSEGEFLDEIRGALLSLSQAVGRISHHHLKSEHKIRGSEAKHRAEGKRHFTQVIVVVQSLCTMFGFDFVDLYSSVWAQVKKRDWNKARKQATV